VCYGLGGVGFPSCTFLPRKKEATVTVQKLGDIKQKRPTREEIHHKPSSMPTPAWKIVLGEEAVTTAIAA
jgi:hypothetical protein